MSKLQDYARRAAGLPLRSSYDEYQYRSSGSVARHYNVHDSYDEADLLWERMYVNPRPVIIVCGFCKAHNVITSPCCIQCGAPMGAGVERQYG